MRKLLDSVPQLLSKLVFERARGGRAREWALSGIFSSIRRTTGSAECASGDLRCIRN